MIVNNYFSRSSTAPLQKFSIHNLHYLQIYKYSLTSLTIFYFNLAVACLTTSLCAQTVPPYSLQVTRSCFHFLYNPVLCLSFARSFLFIHTGLLAFLPDFLFLRMDQFCSLQKVTLECQPTFLDLFTFQVLIPYNSSKQIPEEDKVCSPEVQACGLMVTAAKTAFDLHFPSEPFLVCEYEVQQSIHHWLLCQLCQDVFINAIHELLDCLCTAVLSLQLVPHGGLGLGL